jgi:hypothetical protein
MLLNYFLITAIIFSAGYFTKFITTPVEAAPVAIYTTAASTVATDETIVPATTARAFYVGSLSAGRYIVGEDISAGKYDVTATSGMGNFMGSVASCQFGTLNEVLAVPGNNEIFKNSTYSNLRLTDGDEFTISSDLVLEFISK